VRLNVDGKSSLVTDPDELRRIARKSAEYYDRLEAEEKAAEERGKEGPEANDHPRSDD
jgi:TfoX/Sxy family transcriptional regulator of competence genes